MLMRKILTFVTAVLCGTTMLLAQEDTRTRVTSAVFTGTLTYPETGDVWNWSKRNEIASALTAQNSWYSIYDGATSSFAIEKKGEGDEWSSIDYGSSQTLTAGTYRYRSQLRVDGDNGTLYRLPDPTKSEANATLTVDGKAWTVSSASVYPTFSYAWVTSPEFELAKVSLPFSFDFKNELNYGVALKDQAVTEKDLKNYTIGGSEVYTYTKVTNNVPWLNVSEAGIISGTPTAISKAEVKEKIRVSDGVNEPIEFEITAGKVAPAQNEREVISTASFTGWENPAIGDELTYSYKNTFQSKIAAAAGAHYRLPEASSFQILKKDGEDWNVMADNETFTAGDYKWQTQLRCDNEDGWFYILDEAANMSVTINGEDCTVSSGSSGNGFSYLYISRGFTLSDATAANDAQSADKKESKKILIDGTLYIITPEGTIFNAQGAKVK